jgi:2-amino-4-hydroxy-6-hydroxymethyldihydropteridine diphosphokinase
MILIAIGANLAAPDGRTSYQLCNDAVDAMAVLPGLAVSAVSRWYRSEPVPWSEQPDYVNGCVRLDVAPGADEPDPQDMLTILQRIEQAHGRQRSIANAARTLDLDIVAMGVDGALVRDRPDPVLPHPRMHLRAFVLLPLRDVAPHWVHPRSGLTIDRLIDALPPADLAPDRISAI